jgi:hypothetical protein
MKPAAVVPAIRPGKVMKMNNDEVINTIYGEIYFADNLRVDFHVYPQKPSSPPGQVPGVRGQYRNTSSQFNLFNENI